MDSDAQLTEKDLTVVDSIKELDTSQAPKEEEKKKKWYEQLGAALDFIFNKLVPKKLSIVVLATVIVFMDKNPAEFYWWILLIYLGMNVTGAISRNISGAIKAKGEINGNSKRTNNGDSK